MAKQPVEDAEVMEAVRRIPGVVITHHYGAKKDYYVHFRTLGDAALMRALRLSALANCQVHVYAFEARKGAEPEARYIFVVPAASRENLLLAVQDPKSYLNMESSRR